MEATASIAADTVIETACNFVRDEYATHVVYPPADDIFNAMHFTPLDKVKVLILGQDPYHEPGQAQGLAFYVPPEIQTPPSLVNIAKELKDDLGQPPTTNSQHPTPN